MKKLLSVLLCVLLLLSLLPGSVAAADIWSGWSYAGGWSLQADGSLKYTGTNEIDLITYTGLACPQELTLSVRVDAMPKRDNAGVGLLYTSAAGDAYYFGYLPYYGTFCIYKNNVPQTAAVTRSLGISQWGSVGYSISDECMSITVNGEAVVTLNGIFAGWEEGSVKISRYDLAVSVKLEQQTLSGGVVPMSENNYGWLCEDNNYAGWTAIENGAVLYADGSITGSRALHKSLLEDPNNFLLDMTLKIIGHRAYIKVLGTVFEIDCSGGNGNQVFDKHTWKWCEAANQTVRLTLSRLNGGEIYVRLLGKGALIPLSYTAKAENTSDTNVYIGMYDRDAAATFSDITAKRQAGSCPQLALTDWETDIINGVMDFSGWATEDGSDLTVDYGKTAAQHRVWTEGISKSDKFHLSFLFAGSEDGAGYVELLGQRIELRGSGRVSVSCLNGTLRTSFVSDKDGERSDSVLTAADSGSRLTFGIMAGTAVFRNIQIVNKLLPLLKASYAGDAMTPAFAQRLNDEIGKYQNCLPDSCCLGINEAVCREADLIVVSHGTEALLSGVSAADFAEDYEKKVSVLTAAQPQAIVVLTGIGYLSDEALGNVSLADYAAYQAAICGIARKYDAVYADIYAAMGDNSAAVAKDGRSLTDLGTELVEGEILAQLLRRTPSLAVNTTVVLSLTSVPAPALSDAALRRFISADNAAALEAAAEDAALGLSLPLYRSLTGAERAQVLQTLLAADRSGLNHESANALFLGAVMPVSRARTVMECRRFTTYVAVGDSIAQGIGAVDWDADGWVTLFSQRLAAAQGTELTVINKALGGTRLCTDFLYEGDTYPAGKGKIQEYIVDNHPDLLTVSYGINDYHGGTSLNVFIDTLRSYLQQIKAVCPDTTIVVFGLCAKGGDNEGGNLRMWNKAIRELAEEQDVLYGDTYYPMRGVDWLLTDGIHPDNAGYCVMANAALQALLFRVRFLAPKTYTVTWSVNGTQTQQSYEEGQMPVFDGSTDRTDDDTYSYSFTGWEPALAEVTVDVNYTAQYSQTPLSCEHDWQLDTEKSVAATCIEAGKKAYICSKCLETKEELIEALGHNWDEGKITTEPTAAEKGVKTYICSRCNATKTEEIPATGEPVLPFTDVKEGKWYYEAVKFAYVNKLFAGTSGTTFSPDGNMSRGMLVSVLWRMENSPEPTGSNPFTDVPEGKWYTKAVVWAAENKLVAGDGKGHFNPNGDVTREQIAVFMLSYAKFKNTDTSKTADLSKFPDADKVSGWARDALSWANAEGLVTGAVIGGQVVLNPKGNASRAQVASILMRYIQNHEK